MNLIQCIERERDFLNHLLEVTNQAVRKAPAGSLHRIRCKNTDQFYHRHPNAKCRGTGDYIRKSNLTLASQLAQKAYDLKILKAVRERVALIDQLLSHYAAYDIKSFYDELPEVERSMVDPRGLSDRAYAEAWQEYKYASLGFHEGDPEIYTDRGERVRSKSEKIIADKLFREGVPYRYECPLQLQNGRIVHPDFAILNVKNRKVYYLEHAGMMDDLEYSVKFVNKIHMYEQTGIFLGDKLIITTETQDRPLDTQLLNVIIQRYFLGTGSQDGK